MAILSDLFSKFSFLPKKFVGIDIGTTSIKVAELRYADGVFHLTGYGILTNYGHLERINDAIQTRTFKVMEENTAKLLDALLKHAKIDATNAVMSVPAFSAFTTTVDFPVMSRREIAQSVPYQARQFVPVPLNEVLIDWQIVEESVGKLVVLLVAIPNDIVGRYIKIAKLAHLKLSAMELEAISLARCLMSKDPTPSLLVDIGGRSTTFSITDKTTVRLTTSIDISGGDLSQVIATGLSIDPFRAEEIKKAYGLKPPPGQESVAHLMLPLIETIKSESYRVIENYARRTGVRVSQIVLTGGSANLPGLLEYWAKDSPYKVIKGDPFELGYIRYVSHLAPIIKEIGTSLTVACGLAMRNLKI